jgi:hypothetical protein
VIAAMLMLLQAAAPAPTAAPAAPPPEALALGRKLAESGTLASLLPMMAAKDTDELVRAHPELTVAEQDELRRAVTTTFETGRDRLFAAEARAYADKLTVAEMTALVAFHTGPVAARYRAALPAAITAAMGAMEGFDLKKDSWTAFCARPGRTC